MNGRDRRTIRRAKTKLLTRYMTLDAETDPFAKRCILTSIADLEHVIKWLENNRQGDRPPSMGTYK
jgi:hypothetical protein